MQYEHYLEESFIKLEIIREEEVALNEELYSFYAGRMVKHWGNNVLICSTHC
jgi:hypothetical protein